MDSGANFGIVELPMVVAVTPAGRLVSPTNVTVYYDDRGWVVAYLPAAAPAAGIWRYDPQDTGECAGRQGQRSGPEPIVARHQRSVEPPPSRTYPKIA